MIAPVLVAVKINSQMRCKQRADSKQRKKLKNEGSIGMLYKTKTLKGYTLNSIDGEIGKVKEFYFDDRHWVIRYLVADTGNWLTDRQVLISPHVLGQVIEEDRQITVELTKKQIEESPSLDSDKPVSRQYEETYYGFYGWPMYWSGPFIWGAYPYLERDSAKWKEAIPKNKVWDTNLRSTHDVSGHRIQAVDGEIGHVDGFILDDETWAICYLVVDTQNWWPGRKVLISPQWIERVSWEESKVFINLPRETIKRAPEYQDGALLTRDYEVGLYRHYNRKGYWIDESVAKEHSR